MRKIGRQCGQYVYLPCGRPECPKCSVCSQQWDSRFLSGRLYANTVFITRLKFQKVKSCRISPFMRSSLNFFGARVEAKSRNAHAQQSKRRVRNSAVKICATEGSSQFSKLKHVHRTTDFFHCSFSSLFNKPNKQLLWLCQYPQDPCLHPFLPVNRSSWKRVHSDQVCVLHQPLQ